MPAEEVCTAEKPADAPSATPNGDDDDDQLEDDFIAAVRKHQGLCLEKALLSRLGRTTLLPWV